MVRVRTRSARLDMLECRHVLPVRIRGSTLLYLAWCDKVGDLSTGVCTTFAPLFFVMLQPQKERDRLRHGNGTSHDLPLHLTQNDRLKQPRELCDGPINVFGPAWK